MNNIFFDTNVLVYAYDTHDPLKQEIAKSLLISTIRQGQGYVSLQVFGEFFNVVTRRIAKPLSTEKARLAINYLSILNIVDMDLELVHRAIDAHQKYRTSYWDSLIIAASERAKCSKLLSEDLNATQLYHGVVVENPFLV